MRSPNQIELKRTSPKPDTLTANLISLKFPKAIVNEIKQRKKLGQPRTQIAREMKIPKLHINRILEVR